VTREVIDRGAELSPCERYRWSLHRVLEGGDGRCVCFVMLNPSTADALQDDPTVRRCIGYADSWGFSRLVVRNLFPYRATDKRELLKVDSPVGGERGDQELQLATLADLVVAAWGAWVPFRRADAAERLLRGRAVYCLNRASGGQPVHPLYQPASLQPQLLWAPAS
jgi:hypothetical protein